MQPMMPIMPSFSPSNITTDQIQKCLDENKKLILAILENQNLGKLAECAQYQAQLQKNLMYLAAIADAQPLATTMPPQQMPPQPAMQPGGFYMQHPMTPQPQGVFPQKTPLQYSSPHYHQMQEQQQQLLPQATPLGGGAAPPPTSAPSGLGGGNKQDDAQTGSVVGSDEAK